MEIKRRTVLTIMISNLAIALTGSWYRSLAKDAELEVEWRVTEQQAEVLSKKLDVKKIDTYDQRNPILIGAVVLVGVALVPKIAEAIGDVYFRFKSSGGVILDVRSKPIVISTSDRVAPGYALIITDSGAKAIQVGGSQPIKGEDLKALLDVLMAATPKG